jgi:hypothetical protein
MEEESSMARKIMDGNNKESMKEPTEEEDIAVVKKAMKECIRAGFRAGFHCGMLEQHKRLWPNEGVYKKKNVEEYWQERKDEVWRKHT